MLLAGSWFPNQGLNLGSLQWKHGVLTTGLPGNSQLMILNRILTGELRRDVDYLSNVTLGFSALVPPAGSIYEHIQIF